MSIWVFVFCNLLCNCCCLFIMLFVMVVGLIVILLFGGYVCDINYGFQISYVCQGGYLQIQYCDYFLYGSGDFVLYGIVDYWKIIDILFGDFELVCEVMVVMLVLMINGIVGNFVVGVLCIVLGSGIVVVDQNWM